LSETRLVLRAVTQMIQQYTKKQETETETETLKDKNYTRKQNITKIDTVKTKNRQKTTRDNKRKPKNTGNKMA